MSVRREENDRLRTFIDAHPRAAARSPSGVSTSSVIAGVVRLRRPRPGCARTTAFAPTAGSACRSASNERALEDDRMAVTAAVNGAEDRRRRRGGGARSGADGRGRDERHVDERHERRRRRPGASMASSPAISDDSWPSSARGLSTSPPESGAPRPRAARPVLARPDDHDGRGTPPSRKAPRGSGAETSDRPPSSRAFGAPHPGRGAGGEDDARASCRSNPTRFAPKRANLLTFVSAISLHWRRFKLSVWSPRDVPGGHVRRIGGHGLCQPGRSLGF